MKNLYLSLMAVVLVIGMQSCQDEINTEIKHYSADELEVLSSRLDLPSETHPYPILTNGTSFNPSISENPYHKATLGRVLFYDNLLSKDESVSCASCHRQENAFADNARFSEGIEEKIGVRNSLPLGNTIGFVRYYGTDLSLQSGFFSWDESKPTINDQSAAAIVNPIEMGHDWPSLIEKVNEQDYYQILFKKAYAGPASKDNILESITEFVNALSSRESKFDSENNFNPYQTFEGFTASENRGKALFNSHCSSCHDANHNAIVQSHANNGLELNYADKGMGANQSGYDGVFKVPSLRNVELTGPYMHDGRFNTLEEVIEHYNSGIVEHENLHPALKGPSGNPMRLNLSNEDKKAMVDYLKTLTDNKFITEEKFSNPFI